MAVSEFQVSTRGGASARVTLAFDFEGHDIEFVCSLPA